MNYSKIPDIVKGLSNEQIEKLDLNDFLKYYNYLIELIERKYEDEYDPINNDEKYVFIEEIINTFRKKKNKFSQK